MRLGAIVGREEYAGVASLSSGYNMVRSPTSFSLDNPGAPPSANTRTRDPRHRLAPLMLSQAVEAAQPTLWKVAQIRTPVRVLPLTSWMISSVLSIIPRSALKESIS